MHAWREANKIWKSERFWSQRVCAWPPHLDRAGLTMAKIWGLVKTPNAGRSWPYMSPPAYASVAEPPDPASLILSIVANTCLVTRYGLGWIRAKQVEEDFSRSLTTCGELRWPYGRSVSQAVS